jgi:hypothetical protein
VKDRKGQLDKSQLREGRTLTCNWFPPRKLSQEEYERQDREQRLTAADEKVVLAAEEVKTYK